ncbi:hypothetical protein HMPREF2534_00104 [Bacteroides thetaiotaomicron]|nr:hypothetical protein HMPREF2534_00104 [Bacteroides thetaiotaomicron]
MHEVGAQGKVVQSLFDSSHSCIVFINSLSVSFFILLIIQFRFHFTKFLLFPLDTCPYSLQGGQNQFLTKIGVFRRGDNGIRFTVVTCQRALLGLPVFPAGGFAAFLAVVVWKAGFLIYVKGF